jgi:hypothetical protein
MKTLPPGVMNKIKRFEVLKGYVHARITGNKNHI